MEPEKQYRNNGGGKAGNDGGRDYSKNDRPAPPPEPKNEDGGRKR